LRARAITALGFSVTTLACGDAICLSAPSIVVQADIRDSITNAPAAHQASLIVEGNGVYDSTFVGTVADSLTRSNAQITAPGQTGEYTVRVRRSGYRLWERRGIHIDGSECSAGAINPVALSVRLQRLP
jgi:uncharacterized iron-regulated membrane protein